MTTAASEPAATPTERSSLIRRSVDGDKKATAQLFRQFVPPDEQIYFAEYLGVQGFFGLGQLSFGCVTERRVASLRIGALDGLIYQDGFLADVNSGVIFLPSELPLRILMVFVLLFSLVSLGLPLLILPVLPRWYYRIKKCGVVFWIREGVMVYMFSNRGKFAKVRDGYRMCSALREKRIQQGAEGARSRPSG
ncbi:MAG: hypothetical protein H6811_06045 [Phycisphaeraceae bacterium]|nr:hypothetical protein [Phycisphaeraceae bacterium]